MKKNILYSALTIVVAALLMSNSGGRASSGFDSTGRVSATQTCQQCHNGGGFGNATIAITVTNGTGAPVTNYIAGLTYNVRITISAATNSPAAGFQAVVVNSANAQAGTLAAVSNNVHISLLNGREYAEQTQASTLKTFDFSWTAPAAGTGIIKIFAAGNAVNDTGGSAGDSATGSVNVSLAETTAVATGNNTATTARLHILTNPANDVLRLQAEGIENGNYSIQITDFSGRNILNINTYFSENQPFINIDISKIASGIYAVSLFKNGENRATTTMVK
ncbi:MAG: hypothetical protein RI894_2149 [Bacteroidota bacterium]|jgi:hypothetical protein